VVYDLQDTLDEITYVSVKWGRLYEILAKSLEHSWKIQARARPICAPQRQWQELWGCDAGDRPLTYTSVFGSYSLLHQIHYVLSLPF